MKTLGRRIGLFVAFAALVAFSRAGAQSSLAPDIVRGRHLATALTGCEHCHGATFAGGRAFMRGDQTIYSANLTGGAGGVGGYSDAALRRAIRGGVAPDGTMLRIMPTSDYAAMTDDDVDDVIAFLRSLPSVDRVISRVGAAAAQSTQGVRPVDDGGAGGRLAGAAYLVKIGGCTNCHGANLAGGGVRQGVVVPNISHDGVGSWSFADFQTAMRTGKTPDGRMLSTVMPWKSVGKMTDDELRAVYDFLESMPAHPN